jgi:multicomponent Na+:H+ antiporter subunit G
MSDVVVVLFLLLGVAIELLCCVGMLVAKDVFDRLHFLGPACTLGPLFIAAAIVVREGLSLSGNKALIVAVVIIVTSPVLTHATARSARTRMSGHWEAFPEEIVTDK